MTRIFVGIVVHITHTIIIVIKYTLNYFLVRKYMYIYIYIYIYIASHSLITNVYVFVRLFIYMTYMYM